MLEAEVFFSSKQMGCIAWPTTEALVTTGSELLPMSLLTGPSIFGCCIGKLPW